MRGPIRRREVNAVAVARAPRRAARMAKARWGAGAAAAAAAACWVCMVVVVGLVAFTAEAKKFASTRQAACEWRRGGGSSGSGGALGRRGSDVEEGRRACDQHDAR